LPDVRGLELAGICLPAIGVGGDYYDFLPLPDERIGLVIGDVSGKGVPAALLMAGLQPRCAVWRFPASRLRDQPASQRHAPPVHVGLALRHAVLCDLRSARPQPSIQQRGHFPPIHVGPRDAARLSQGGLPIGLMPGSLYGEGRRELGVGDLVAFYTDGVVETPNLEGEEFGEDAHAGDPEPACRHAARRGDGRGD
jgi:sigma-B regulation protein RsbU (phosphoserine phosphatase)